MDIACGLIVDFGKWKLSFVLIALGSLLVWEASYRDSDRIGLAMSGLCVGLLVFAHVQC